MVCRNTVILQYDHSKAHLNIFWLIRCYDSQCRFCDCRLTNLKVFWRAFIHRKSKLAVFELLLECFCCLFITIFILLLVSREALKGSLWNVLLLNTFILFLLIDVFDFLNFFFLISFLTHRFNFTLKASQKGLQQVAELVVQIAIYVMLLLIFFIVAFCAAISPLS